MYRCKRERDVQDVPETADDSEEQIADMEPDQYHQNWIVLTQRQTSVHLALPDDHHHDEERECRTEHDDFPGTAFLKDRCQPQQEA